MAGWDDPSGGRSTAISDAYNLAQIPLIRQQLPMAIAQTQLAQIKVQQAQREQQAYQQIAARRAIAQQIQSQQQDGQAQDGLPPDSGQQPGISPPGMLQSGGQAGGQPAGAMPSAGQQMSDLSSSSGGYPDFIKQQFLDAEVLASNGLISQANKTAGLAYQNLQRYESARSSQSRDKLNNLKAAHESAKYLNNLTQGMDSPEGYDRGRLQYMADNPGNPLPPWFSLPYDQAKPYIDQLRTSSEEGQKLALTRAQTERSRAATAASRASEKATTTLNYVRDQKLKMMKEQEDLALKSGGAIPMFGSKGKQQAGADPLAEGLAGEKQFDPKMSAIEANRSTVMINAAIGLHRSVEQITMGGPAFKLATLDDIIHETSPSVLDAWKKQAAVALTDQEARKYEAVLAGMSTQAAMIAAQGNAARMTQMLMEQKALTSFQGDTSETALYKLYTASYKALSDISGVRAKTPQAFAQLKGVQKDLRDQADYLAAALKKLDPNIKLAGIDESPEKRFARSKQEAEIPSGLPKGAALQETQKDGTRVYSIPGEPDVWVFPDGSMGVKE